MVVGLFETMLRGNMNATAGADQSAPAPGMVPRHVCAVDQQGKGTLMWALGCGFCGMQLPLTLAQCNGFLPTLQRLLELFVTRCGAPIDQRMEHGKTMLMFLAGSGCPGATKLALDLGASVRMRDSEGWTALMVACRGSEQIKAGAAAGEAAVLDQNNATDAFVLHQNDAADTAVCEVLSLLADAGADINAQNLNGLSALHLASMHLKPLLVKQLLDLGAKPDLSSGGGAMDTPLLCATQQRDISPPAADTCIAILKVALAKGDLMKAVSLADDPAMAALRYTKEFENPLVALANEWKETLDEEFSDPMTGALPAHDSVGGHKSAAIQESELSKAILKRFGVDEGVLTMQGVDHNWYGKVHTKVMEMVPGAYAKIYTNPEAPTDEEWLALTASTLREKRSEGEDLDPHAELKRQSLIPHPQGFGWISKTFATNFHQLVSAPLCHTVGFAVPSQEALDVVAKCSPLIEVGAGTGYWAALLQKAGADIIAYDAEPPSLCGVGTSLGNRFFNHQFTAVEAGEAVSLFEAQPGARRTGAAHAGRALLMIYPENPAHVDAGAYASWDARCVGAYLRAGGQTVIYVGDRKETCLSGGLYAWGETSSAELHEVLAEKFMLAETVKLPNWPYIHADLTVWERRQ